MQLGDATHDPLGMVARLRPSVLWVLSIAALLFAAWLVARVLPGWWGIDARSYWLPDPIGRYELAEQSLVGVGPFRYTPVAALPVIAFGLLPWGVFLVAWTALLVAAVAWLVGPRWTPLALALVPVTFVIWYGNVTLLFAVVLVVGLRHPLAWLLPLLTKVTPAVGLLWFAARGEWRALGLVALATAVLAAVAEVLLPGSWSTWWHAIQAQSEMAEPAFLPRVALAAAIVIVAARIDRPVLLPFALVLTVPRLGLGPWVVLLAVPKLLQEGARIRQGTPAPPDDFHATPAG